MSQANKRTKQYEALLKRRGYKPDAPMATLAGIEELRAAVQWADSEPEYTHNNQTPEQILARYRAAEAGDALRDRDIRTMLSAAETSGDKALVRLCKVALNEGATYLRASVIDDARRRLAVRFAKGSK